MTEIDNTWTDSKTKEAAEALEWAQSIEVTTDEELRTYVKGTALLKEELKQVTDKKAELLKPYKDPTKEIGETFKPLLEALTEAEKALKGKLAGYVIGLINRKNALLEDATAPGLDADRRAEILKEAGAIQIPEVSGLSIREEWKGEFQEEGAHLLLDALQERNLKSFIRVDEKALAKYTKEKSEDLDLPGWKCYKKTIITITPSRVEQ
ncbi:MAG: hypothetical protein GY765_34360 [bacterium]|nr:hypothetical protein [bacterium]